MRHAAILATLERVFPAVGVAPGVQTLFWASADKVDANPSLLVERFKQRNLQSLTMQVGRAWLLDRLQSMNLAEYRRDLLSASFVASWDFRPVTYLYGLVENAERVSPAFGRVALSFAKAVWAPSSVLALVLGLAVVVLVVRHGRGAPGFAAGAAGAAGMALQLVLLLAFQSLRGHLYHALGGLLAGFMGGMAVGAWLGQHLVHRRRALAAMCAVASALAATISPLLHLAQKVPSLSVTLLLVLLSGIGLATGAIFPLAVHGASGPEGGRATSIYAWDLAGAAGAAVLGSLVAIPLLGFEAVAWTSCALYATAALANGRARR
jgi:spermidine synthase